MGGLLAAIGSARREVVIVSPYFAPGEIGMSMMRDAAAHGVRIVLFTNSIASTDEPLVHHHYAAYRTAMLALGVEIHEFSPGLVQRRRTYGEFGRSLPRLHAKVALVDRERLLVGSVNLDARSEIGNTEMAVVIDSPALVGELWTLVLGDRLGSVYRLRLAALQALAAVARHRRTPAVTAVCWPPHPPTPSETGPCPRSAATPCPS